jgi:PmbA protein
MDAHDLLDAVLAAARQAGADAADALMSERASLSLSWRLGRLEDLERKDGREIGLRVLVGRRVATAATTHADLATLRALAEDAMATARFLPEDPWAGLAEADELARHWPDLNLAEEGEPSLDSLQSAAAAAEDAARAVAGVTNSDGASASWSRSQLTLASTNGFRGSYARTRHALHVTVLAGTGTGMQRDYEFRQATHRADLPHQRPSAAAPASGRRGASTRARWRPLASPWSTSRGRRRACSGTWRALLAAMRWRLGAVF